MPTAQDFLPLPAAAFHILVALAEGTRHGYAVMKEAGLNPGTLYTTIKRLLENELIRETQSPANADSSDERRRYYAITPLGRRVVRAELERLQGVIDQAARKLCDV
jgi:DNA-binding PadR family transcriptional regulator